MELGRFCALIISLVLANDPWLLPSLLMISKAFTQAIKDFKSPMSLINRAIARGYSRKKGGDVLRMLREKLAFDGVQMISLQKVTMTGENMLHFLALAAKVPYVKELDLSRTGLTCEGVRLLARAVRGLKFLEIVNVAHNRIKWPGVSTLAKVSVERKNITRLDLDGNLFWANIPEKLLLCEMNLRELDVSETKMEDENMAMLVKQQENAAVKLKELRVQQNNLTAKGAFLDAVLLRMKVLGYLCIDQNNIGDEGAKFIADALGNSKMTSLHMMKNGIGDEGAVALAFGLVESTTVRCVSLFHNDFSETGMDALKVARKDHVSLRWFYVE
jgi:Ran GTPase-activating protein (RanGAP) involved in mRNA processing and transport